MQGKKTEWLTLWTQRQTLSWKNSHACPCFQWNVTQRKKATSEADGMPGERNSWVFLYKWLLAVAGLSQRKCTIFKPASPVWSLEMSLPSPQGCLPINIFAWQKTRKSNCLLLQRQGSSEKEVRAKPVLICSQSLTQNAEGKCKNQEGTSE